MGSVICSSTLHRAIKQGGLREIGEGAAPPDGAGRLGNWAATLAGGNLVVAIDVFNHRIAPDLRWSRAYAGREERRLQKGQPRPSSG
jgi:hypothetical protein